MYFELYRYIYSSNAKPEAIIKADSYEEAQEKVTKNYKKVWGQTFGLRWINKEVALNLLNPQPPKFIE